MATSEAELTITALMSVRNERASQDRKWGRQRHSWPEWMAILGEEYGEACGEANRYHWSHTLPSPDTLRALREELVQTAAVAVAIIEHIDELMEAGQ